MGTLLQSYNLTMNWIRAASCVILTFCFLITTLKPAIATTFSQGVGIEISKALLSQGRYVQLEKHLHEELSRLGIQNADQILKTITLTLPETGANTYKKESFRITLQDNGWRIETTNNVGHLRGFYRLLEDMGFLFVSTHQTITPTNLELETKDSLGSIITPQVEKRGLWAFGDNLNPDFLIWAVRNSFNLVGGNFTNIEQKDYELFGVYRWDGSHNVISTLTPSSYINPCFGNRAYIDFFVEKLIDEAVSGIYKNTDILNIWPSDKPVMVTGRHCKRAPGSNSASDDFIFFLNQVTHALSQSEKMRASNRNLTIAGIGYYGTYDVSSSGISIQHTSQNETANYKHIFYNNVRSYASKLNANDNQANQRLINKLDRTIKRHSLDEVGFGVVDYFNYSLYRGIVSPHAKIIHEDLKTLSDRGISLWAYMHPSLYPSPFQSSLDHIISRASRGIDTSMYNRDRFARLFAGPHAPQFFKTYESSISEISEIMGAESSLLLILQSDKAWSRPILNEKQMTAALTLLLKGGDGPLPSIRLKEWPAIRYKGAGLEKIIYDLQNLETALAAEIASSKEKWKKNLILMKDEVVRTKLIRTIISAAARHKLSHDINACLDEKNIYDTSIATLSTLNWPEKLSHVNEMKDDLEFFRTIISQDSNCELK